jgi:hypothetical protein
MIDFPTLTSKPDSKKYSFEFEDPVVRSKIEGGYVVSRPRHTRSLRRTWSVGYTFISDADKLLLQAHYQAMRGGSDIFRWYNHEDYTWYNVRFVEQVEFKYVGAGYTKRWDIAFKVEQA